MAGPDDARLSRELSSMRWFLMGLLTVHAFSNPNLSVATFWVVVGFIIGLLAKIEAVAAFERGSSTSGTVQPSYIGAAHPRQATFPRMAMSR
jgi:hypothetical protein